MSNNVSRFNISLEELKFHSPIGVFDEEREVGNDFRVDVHLGFDASGFVDEDLTTSISYADIYDIVAEEMSKERLLLESVAKKITDRVTTRWEDVTTMTVKVCKLTAPIPGLRGNCCVEYFFEKKC